MTSPEAVSMWSFRCNICGAENSLPAEQVIREGGHCTRCRSYGRLRSMVHAVMQCFLPGRPALGNAPLTKRIRGVGCSDAARYAVPLAKVFDYTNTFLDKSPRLDLSDVDWDEWQEGSLDFITTSDVLEHVAPPVERALDNVLRLLKPGGVLIATVPTTPWDHTIEHYPVLEDWSIVREKGQPVLLNRRADGTEERFHDLRFHGGEGQTLEFRRFSRSSLLESLTRAGFEIAAVHDEPVVEHGIPLGKHNLVVTARRPVAAPVSVAPVTAPPATGAATGAVPDRLAGAVPLFVLGAPRSGTTFCAHILNAHPQVLMTNEVCAFSFFDHAFAHIPDGDAGGLQYSRSHPDAFVAALHDHMRPVLLETFARIAEAEGCGPLRFWGDKNPHYADCLGLIHGTFPDARYIRMKRDPRDITCSIMEMNGWEAERAAWAVKQNLTRAVRFLAGLPQGMWRDVVYEDLTRHPESQLEPLFKDFLGLDDIEPVKAWLEGNARFDRHRRFRDETDFVERSIFRWKRDLDERQLEVVESVLADEIDSEGYRAFGS